MVDEVVPDDAGACFEESVGVGGDAGDFDVEDQTGIGRVWDEEVGAAAEDEGGDFVVGGED